ncbi:MAG: AAA family ATPase [Burkholderiales bacterium]|nr:AAA family ATPase [Burkholderiales bacterium]
MASDLICLLDEARLHLAEEPVEWPCNVPGLLLARLAIDGEWQSRDALLALFWPERPASEALHNLRVNLHRGRQWLAGHGLGERLESERRRVRLVLDCDVRRFRAALAAGDWAGARRLRRQPLLKGMALPGFAAVDDWLGEERAAIERAWRDATLRDAERLAAIGRGDEAWSAFDELVRHDPTDERAVEAALRLARQSGEAARGLALFDRFATQLEDDLGAAPGATTLSLAESLRGRTPARAPEPANPPSAEMAAMRPASSPLLRPPLVGRVAEAERLRGSAAAITVVAGEAGIGKTWLVESTLGAATWLTCKASSRGASLQPLIDYVEDTLDALAELPGFSRHRAELARLVPAAFADESPPPLAASGGAGLRLALADLLESIGRPIVVDDLQWADPVTLELIALLASRQRVPLVATLRSGGPAPAAIEAWLAGLAATLALERIDLEPLDEPALRALLSPSAGSGDAAPEALATFGAWLHRQSGGNPYFAVETLRSLLDAGRLRASAAGWTGDLAAIAATPAERLLPGRLLALVRQRIDGLDERTRRALGVAAVAGDARHLDVLAAVAGLAPLQMAEAIAEAQAAGLLAGRRFAHALVRDALYLGTSEAVRAVLHADLARRAATLLTAHRRAEHWWAAGDLEEAVAATLQAAAQDRHRGLHDQAAQLLRDALAQTEAPDLRAELLADLARTAFESAAAGDARDHAEQALALLPRPTARARALVVLAALAFQNGTLDEADRCCARAAESDPDQGELLLQQSNLAFHRGHFDAAIAALTRRVAALRRSPPGPQLAETLTSLGTAWDNKGDLERGLAFHQEAWALAGQLGAHYVRVDVAVNLLWSLPELGRHDEALAFGLEALALGAYDGTQTLLNNLAWLHLDRGRFDEAARLYRRLAAEGDPTLRCFAWAKLLQIHAEQGQEAERRAALAGTLSAMPGTELYQAHAVAILAVLEHGDRDDAGAVLPFLRPQPLDAFLQGRLDQALERHAAEARQAGTS